EGANSEALRRLGGKRWRSPAFELARRLKNEPRLRGLSGLDAADLVNAALAEIHAQEEEGFLWEKFIGHNTTDGQQIDPYTDFVHCWDKCRGADEGALSRAYQAMMEHPPSEDHFGEGFQGGRWEPFRRFLSLAERLQSDAGDSPIFLAVTPLADLFAVAEQQISRWRGIAERAGFLETITPARPGKATEFLFRRPPDTSPRTAP
ncbi:MAG: hypothetical protein L0191_14045, partial [Acidobacteria bacterium]|nr:hypothetical protein [Acidobacteriota bacterium]